MLKSKKSDRWRKKCDRSTPALRHVHVACASLHESRSEVTDILALCTGVCGLITGHPKSTDKWRKSLRLTSKRTSIVRGSWMQTCIGRGVAGRITSMAGCDSMIRWYREICTRYRLGTSSPANSMWRNVKSGERERWKTAKKGKFQRKTF